MALGLGTCPHVHVITDMYTQVHVCVCSMHLHECLYMYVSICMSMCFCVHIHKMLAYAHMKVYVQLYVVHACLPAHNSFYNERSSGLRTFHFHILCLDAFMSSSQAGAKLHSALPDHFWVSSHHFPLGLSWAVRPQPMNPRHRCSPN